MEHQIIQELAPHQPTTFKVVGRMSQYVKKVTLLNQLFHNDSYFGSYPRKNYPKFFKTAIKLNPHPKKQIVFFNPPPQYHHTKWFKIFLYHLLLLSKKHFPDSAGISRRKFLLYSFMIMNISS